MLTSTAACYFFVSLVDTKPFDAEFDSLEHSAKKILADVATGAVLAAKHYMEYKN